MAECPLVSIILPVKEAARYLGEALASIDAQEYSNYEIIVVYAPSRDNTAEIARAHARVRLVEQGDKRGLAAARNVGLALTQGEFVAFMAADDLWPPVKLRLQIEHFQRNPDIEISVPMMRFFHDPDAPPPPGFDERFLARDYVGVLPEAMMVRRGVYDRIGFYDPTYDTADDVDWLARAKDAHISHAILNEVLLLRRMHGDSIMHRPDAAAINRQHVVRLLRDSIQRQRMAEKTEAGATP